MPSSMNKILRDQGLVPSHADVHLKYVEKERLIRCMYCGKGLMKQQARILTLFEAGELDNPVIMTVPTSIQCHGCGDIWHFRTINR